MNITIYSTTTCAACHLLTEWLDKQSLSYEKKITDTDPAIMAEFMSVNDGSVGVPFTVVKDDAGTTTKIVGFDRAKLQAAIGI